MFERLAPIEKALNNAYIRLPVLAGTWMVGMAMAVPAKLASDSHSSGEGHDEAVTATLVFAFLFQLLLVFSIYYHFHDAVYIYHGWDTKRHAEGNTEHHRKPLSSGLMVVGGLFYTAAELYMCIHLDAKLIDAFDAHWHDDGNAQHRFEDDSVMLEVIGVGSVLVGLIYAIALGGYLDKCCGNSYQASLS